MSVKTYKRDSTFLDINPYCPFAKDHDFIEVTEWHNGEGKSVFVSHNNTEYHLELTHGVFEALCIAWNYKGENNDD